MQNIPYTLVMADDDEDDRLLAQDAMEAAGINYKCHTVNNGRELLDYLRNQGVYANDKLNTLPRVILLDLNMPILDGRETLKELKTDPELSLIPVVVLSTSKNDFDVAESYRFGASSYLVKPTDFESMVEMMKSFSDYWFSKALVPEAVHLAPVNKK